jgi:hypothetical protein
MIKPMSVFFLTVSLLAFQSNSCITNKKSSDEMIKFGPDKFTSLVIFFRKEATREQIETFYNDVISVSRPELRGYDLPEGVVLKYQIRNGGYEGVGITFSTDATPEQREKLKKAIESSPIIFRVYENVVPNEIKDLDEANKPKQ